MPENTAKNASSSENYRGLGSLKAFNVLLKNVDNTKSIDITSLVIEVSIYEDIFSKTMYGDVAIKDSVNLINGEAQAYMKDDKTGGFPIVGEEYIEISYSLTDDAQDKVNRRFSVYAIKNIANDENSKSKNYILQFCSEEHLLDATTLIQKSYREPIGNIVKNILEDYLLVNETTTSGKKKKIYQIQKTKGVQQLVIPKLSPLETLDFLARRSISEKYFTSASYFFFENKDGFNFCDIEYLIYRGKQKIQKEFDDNKSTKNFNSSYRYYLDNVRRGSGAHDDDGRAYKNIISMQQNHKFDTIEKLKRGYFESSIQVYEPITRSISSRTFSFLENAKDTSTLGSDKNNVTYPENSLDFIKTVTTTPVDPPKVKGIFALFNSNSRKDEISGKHTKTFFIMECNDENSNQGKPKTFLDEIYPNRSSYMSRLLQNMFTIEVYGDTKIGAGDVIIIDLPEIDGFTKALGFDKYLSGYFLVSSIHHRLSPDSYHCTYDLFKNGFSMPVVKEDVQSAGAQNAFDPKSTIIDDIIITNANIVKG